MVDLPHLDLTDISVLAVDDDPVSSLLISKILTGYGAQVIIAETGKDALELFRAQSFDAVVTDICMPGMDGLELAACLRQLNDKVQIIAVTAVSDTETLIKTIRLGFNDYITKPIAMEALLWAAKRSRDVIVAERRLAEEEFKFRMVLESMGEGLAIKDLNYRIIYQNRKLTEMFGELAGKPCYAIWELSSPCEGCPTDQALSSGQPCSTSRVHMFGNIPHTIESTVSPMRDANGVVTGTVEIIRDVSERARTEQTIRDMAFRDHLTGLANRRLFEDRLAQSIAKARRNSSRFGLIYLDLDFFKVVNDTYGHDVGDIVLKATAERIRSCFRRDYDTISRYGGDEFCIIIEDVEDGRSLTDIAALLNSRIREPIATDSGLVAIGASLGVAMYPGDGESLMELEMAADHAMYAAKQAGRNTCRFASEVTR